MSKNKPYRIIRNGKTIAFLSKCSPKIAADYSDARGAIAVQDDYADKHLPNCASACKRLLNRPGQRTNRFRVSARWSMIFGKLAEDTK